MRHLMWFRSDLRTHDNVALAAACRDAGRGPDGGVVAVFTIARQQWQEHDWAPVKVDLILRTLAELSASLSALNIPLKIVTVERFADVPRSLLNLARATRCGAIHFGKEYEVNEARRDDAVREEFESAGLGVHAHTDQVLLEPGTLRTTEGRWYTVFTPFKRAALAELPPEVPAHFLGSRVHVRFTHPPEPIGIRIWQSLRRLFLSQFHV